jgi:hypothetical protein
VITFCNQAAAGIRFTKVEEPHHGDSHGDTNRLALRGCQRLARTCCLADHNDHLIEVGQAAGTLEQ